MNRVRIYNEICNNAKNVFEERYALLQCVSSSECSSGCVDASLSSSLRVDQQLRIHLIIPGGIWGSTNDHSNTIVLTLHEQIVAYKCLIHIYPHSKSIASTLKDLLRIRGKKRRRIPYKRRPHSPETRAKMSKSHMGKTFSADSRLRMSEAKIGKKMSEAHIANRVASRVRNGKGFTDATRQKMSESAKNRKKKNKWGLA